MPNLEDEHLEDLKTVSKTGKLTEEEIIIGKLLNTGKDTSLEDIAEKIKKFEKTNPLLDKTLELPQYETNGSVGLDLIARENTIIHPGEIVLIPANIIVETPKGWMFMIASRSSTPKKKGLKFPHSIGVIDQDYCGPADEVKIQVYNFTDKPTTVHRGDKIAQGIFVKVDKMVFEEVDNMGNETRGGFGSTDNKV